MKNRKSDVSVVIASYNCEPYIEETIKSVTNQSLPVTEIIIVDDCSTDGSADKIRDIQHKFENHINIKLICNNTNIGAAESRNRGIEEARCRYIAFLDADDVWKKRKNEYEYNFMRNNGYAFCFTAYEYGDEFANPTGCKVRVPRDIVYKEALSRTVIFTSTVMIDTCSMDKSLIKMPNVPSEDTATWWNILKNGYVGHGIDKDLVIYRRTSGTLSSNKVEAIKRIWNLYTKRESLTKQEAALYFGQWAIRASARRLIKRK